MAVTAHHTFERAAVEADRRDALDAVLVAARHGAADAREALATVERIGGGDADAWVDEWTATAGVAWAAAGEALAAGHRVSAREHLLRAATYYAAALEELRRAASRVARRRCGSGSARASPAPSRCCPRRPSPSRCRTRARTLPGWFFRAPRRRPRRATAARRGRPRRRRADVARARARRRGGRASAATTGSRSTARPGRGAARTAAAQPSRLGGGARAARRRHGRARRRRRRPHGGRRPRTRRLRRAAGARARAPVRGSGASSRRSPTSRRHGCGSCRPARGRTRSGATPAALERELRLLELSRPGLHRAAAGARRAVRSRRHVERRCCVRSPPTASATTSTHPDAAPARRARGRAALAGPDGRRRRAAARPRTRSCGSPPRATPRTGTPSTTRSRRRCATRACSTGSTGHLRRPSPLVASIRAPHADPPSTGACRHRPSALRPGRSWDARASSSGSEPRGPTGTCPGVRHRGRRPASASRASRARPWRPRAGGRAWWAGCRRPAAPRRSRSAAFADLLPADVRSDDLLELMRRSAAALRGRADGRPIVIGVDDAPVARSDARRRSCCSSPARASAFVVVTVRSGEAAPDAITSLWKDAGAPRLSLQPLDEAETTELVEQALGASVEQAAARWIYESSQGNALYVRELAARRAGERQPRARPRALAPGRAARRCASRSAT